MSNSVGVDALKSSSRLLSEWRQERAFRVGTKISWASIFIAILATLVDTYFKMPVIVLIGDAILFAGCLAAIYASRNSRKKLPWLWGPLYIGVWAATFTSLWVTGGIHSPFLGGYLALLLVGGLIIQAHVRPISIALFTLINLAFWAAAEMLQPGQFGVAPPASFNFLIQILVIAALMVYINEFLNTEQSIANELLDRYRELERAQELVSQEEAANTAKSEFLANISHELRTPLGAILGYAELIQDKDTRVGSPQEHAQIILRNGRQLSKLVDDLLDISKIEAGKVEVENIAFNPERLLKDITESMKVQADRKGLRLELFLENTFPNEIISDPTRIKQILVNIIGNAIKFTAIGKVKVQASFKPALSSWIIQVEDTGRGISESEKARLFTPFTQADASITRKYGGTGLGLSLSRQLARLLGGELELASSRIGSGSQFVLSLPVKLLAENVQKDFQVQSTTAPVQGALAGKYLLLVDDTLDNQKLIRLYLEKVGAQVELACNGEEAIRKAMQNDFDLILMDIQMPILDGIQATLKLRQQKFKKPIIALTAHAMKEDREKCLASGFDDYLTKPIDRRILIQKIQEMTQN